MVSIPIYLEALSGSLWAKAIRRSLILLIPLIIAGSLALVINNLPVAAYQIFMVQVFGENWKMAGEYINNLTFGIIGLALTGTVCFNPQFPHTCNFVQFIALMILAYIDKAMDVAHTIARVIIKVRLVLPDAVWKNRSYMDNCPVIDGTYAATIAWIG